MAFTIDCLQYSSAILRTIRTASHTNYDNFNLNTLVRSWIISLGICKQPRLQKYRSSRAGQNLFHKIHSVITNKYEANNRKIHSDRTVSITNLVKVIIANNRSVSATLHHINARSICNKITDFHEFVTEANLTLCAIMETWVSDDEQDVRFKEVPPTGYNIISKPRTSSKKGGGLAIIYKSCLTVRELLGLTRPSEVMELLEILVNFKGIPCNIYTVYHIPNTSVIQVCGELSDLLKHNISQECGNLLIISDFNIHMDDVNHPDTITFTDSLQSFGLVNTVGFQTHKSKHILDLLITDNPIIIKSTMPGYFFSDHQFIEATLHLKRPDPPLKKITYRKIKAINQSEFHNKLASAALDLIHDPSTSLSEMVTTYNTTLNTVLDEFAPVQTKTIRTLHHQPWFNDTIKAEIILQRKKERT